MSAKLADDLKVAIANDELVNFYYCTGLPGSMYAHSNCITKIMNKIKVLLFLVQIDWGLK